MLDAGYPALVDAAFLRRAERDALRERAAALGARFVLLWCEAPVATLRARLRRRAARGRDASDATVAVLARQVAIAEPPGADEAALRLDTRAALRQLDAALAALAAALATGP